MKILETQSATLTNYEVLTHLNGLVARNAERATGPTRGHIPKLKSPNYETIVKELCEYLAPPFSTPHVPSPLPRYIAPSYTPATIRALLTQLKKYDLTKAELLMITNLRPADLGFLDCVVEECDERFKPHQQEEILNVVVEVLNSGVEENGHAERGTEKRHDVEMNGNGGVSK